MREAAALFLLLLTAVQLATAAEVAKVGRISVVTDVDAYYSSVGLYYHPQGERYPYVDSDKEFEIYRDLFLRSYTPQDVVLEAGVYPVPLLGVWMHERSPGLYDRFQLSENFNLIQSVTVGYDEPYALSLFLGNVVKYSPEDITKAHSNKGFMGYTFSAGTKHIKDNMLIDDNWWAFKWEIKGERQVEAEKLNWSFRVGAKWHGNDEIADVYFLGARRNHLDFDAPILSWLLNSGLDYSIAFDQHDSALVEQQLLFNKKLPVRAWKLAFDVEFGFIWRKGAKYSGTLASQGTGEEFFLVLRPQLEF